MAQFSLATFQAEIERGLQGIETETSQS